METPKCISIPLKEYRWLFYLLAGIFLAEGLLLLGCAVAQVFQESGLAVVLLAGLYAAAGLVMAAVGMIALVAGAAWIHMVPEGIAVTAWGRTLRQYSAEDMKTAAAMLVQASDWQLGICCYSLEELADLQEKKLKKHWLTKDEVALRKRSGGWQRSFAWDYLHKAARRGTFLFLRRDILWLELTPELPDMLQAMYPHLNWEYSAESIQFGQPVWKDKDPEKFCRGREMSSGEKGLAWGCVTVIGLMLLLLVVLWEPVLLILLLLLIMLAVIVWILYGGEYDVLHLLPEGIRVTRRNKELAFLPAQEIRTVIRLRDKVNNMEGDFLLVTPLSWQELADREAERLYRRETGRWLLEAWQQIPGYGKYLLRRSCIRGAANFGRFMPEVQVMCRNSQREQTLRRMYPQAEFLELLWGFSPAEKRDCL